MKLLSKKIDLICLFKKIYIPKIYLKKLENHKTDFFIISQSKTIKDINSFVDLSILIVIVKIKRFKVYKILNFCIKLKLL